MSAADGAPQTEGDLCEQPLLIVFGQGPDAEDLARQLGDQCLAARVKHRVRAIDECRGVRLTRYPGLVVVLPRLTSSMKVRTMLEPCSNIISDYRMHWSDGLAAVVASEVDSFEAGVVQLIGERALVHNPTMRSALRKSCYVHMLDQDGPVDIFRVYREASPISVTDEPWAERDDVAGEVLERTWSYLRKWGVSDLKIAPDLLACIKRCRDYFENPTKPQLYRPHPDFERNRLHFILDGPDIQVGNAKTWAENGARVWRYVLQQLQVISPSVQRPGQQNAPGAQKDLRHLYESLKVADAWFRNSRDRRSENTGW